MAYWAGTPSWVPPAPNFASLSFDLEVKFERSRLGILGYRPGRLGSPESQLCGGVKECGLVKGVQHLGSWLCSESLVTLDEPFKASVSLPIKGKNNGRITRGL